MKYKFLSNSGKLADRAKLYRPTVNAGYLVPADITKGAFDLMPEAVAREKDCMPIVERAGTLHVAVSSLDDVHLRDNLRFILNRDIVFHCWPENQIRKSIDEHYGRVEGESADSMLQEFFDRGAIDFTETVDDSSQPETKLSLCSDLSDIDFSEPPSFWKLKRPKRRVPHSGINLSTIGSVVQCLEDSRQNVSHSGDGMFYYTIEEGRKALAYRFRGGVDVVEGPARIWKGLTRFEPMRDFVAHPGEFLLVLFRDGSQQHLKGPARIWFDPTVHESINVQEGLSLAAKEAVVVYGEEEGGATKRRICYGPGLFVPQPGEWLHEFSWHSSRGGSKGVEKVPNGLKFQKMWLMPDQMYHDVRDVRTADDAVLVIRLMIFFELMDIEKMLDTTHDPIGDFINAATSDVVEFTGKLSFEEFKKQTEHLNELSTYAQLLHRAEQCGYKINNVVYRGYGAPDSLQKMHDEAIAARTSLQLEKDTEKQTQELEDYRLQCQVERSERRRVEQETEVDHEILLTAKKKQALSEEFQRQQEVKREQRKRDAELQIELSREQDETRRAHLEQLKEMGVELTEFLTQGRADQVIELRGQGDQKPHLHLNQSGVSSEREAAS